MTDWPTLYLAVIAGATGVMALIQIGVLIYGAQLARRVNRIADRVEREIDPFLFKAQEITTDATRVTKLAVAQVERVDQMIAGLASRAEDALDVAEQVIVTPARRGFAIIEALRGMFSSPGVAEPPSERAPKSAEDDEALFIG